MDESEVNDLAERIYAQYVGRNLMGASASDNTVRRAYRAAVTFLEGRESRTAMLKQVGEPKAAVGSKPPATHMPPKVVPKKQLKHTVQKTLKV